MLRHIFAFSTVALTLAAGAGQPIKGVLVGESTVNHEGGWGPGFRASFGPGVQVVNLARNGRRWKSFRDEGTWAKVLPERCHSTQDPKTAKSVRTKNLTWNVSRGAAPFPGWSLCPYWIGTKSGFSGPTWAHVPSSRKLFHLRPLRARLTTCTPGPNEARNPGPQPPSSLTVDSPTRTTLIGWPASAASVSATVEKAKMWRSIARWPVCHYGMPPGRGTSGGCSPVVAAGARGCGCLQ